MAILVPTAFSTTTDYSTGDRAELNGIVFETLRDVAASTTTPVGNPNWKVVAVLRITEYYSLQDAIEFEINNEDPVVNGSIPSYIQAVGFKLEKILRSPGQRIQRIFTLDANSRFEFTDDMIEIYHVRRNLDGAGGTLAERGNISLQRADRTTFEELRQSYRNYSDFPDYQGIEFPVYCTKVDNEYCYVAPDYEEGTEIAVTYYQRVPELGATVGVLNDMDEPINSAGQTEAEWVAASEDNTVNNFVQQQVVVSSNLWTATIPHVLKAGALVDAFLALNEPEKAALWDAQYKELLAATIEEFAKFDASGSTSIQQSSAYELGR